MTPTRVTFKGNAIRLNDGPAKKPNDLMNDVVNLAGIAFGVLEEVGGIPEDEVGVGEAVQAERIVRDYEELRKLFANSRKAKASEIKKWAANKGVKYGKTPNGSRYSILHILFAIISFHFNSRNNVNVTFETQGC